jgi:hypothetical protein
LAEDREHVGARGWSGLAASFATEAVGRGAQDPALERWWAKAAEFRSGGSDRIVVPAPWTRTIEELCADGVRGEVYAHELVTVAPGAAADLLERARDASPLHARHGWELTGAFTTAMVNDDEALLLWAIPTWQQWADGESDRELARWRRGIGARSGSACCSSTHRCVRSGPGVSRSAPTAPTGRTNAKEKRDGVDPGRAQRGTGHDHAGSAGEEECASTARCGSRSRRSSPSSRSIPRRAR